jgi:hypothetical protein
MGIKTKRSNIKWGNYSTVIVLPAAIDKGAQSTIAANRLMIIDPRGQISEDDLLEFLENHIDPRFHSWLQERHPDEARKTP